MLFSEKQKVIKPRGCYNRRTLLFMTQSTMPYSVHGENMNPAVVIAHGVE
jgi:hypothetical protein